ncbi:MAG TPA: peroxiredoxin-like family protein, partial [Pyrinomonadaceae bacterium]|nr:peroxiredoxin-like family protein [Pyrinomonadaceae bacterium]
MFEKRSQKGKTYAEQSEELHDFLGTIVPQELLGRFDTEANLTGQIDYASKALKAEDTAPGFDLPNAVGKQISLMELLKEGPVIVSFYRGEWCPYCNLQLHAYNRILPQIKSLGANLVAISPQTPDHSLSMKEKNELEFEVLSDQNNQVAKQYGLTFKINEEMRPFHQQAGSDLSQFNGEDSWELPVPGTFIIASNGII